jgi:hypothetical protein
MEAGVEGPPEGVGMSTGTETANGRDFVARFSPQINPVGVGVGYGPQVDPLGFAFEQTGAGQDLVTAVTYGPMVNPLG